MDLPWSIPSKATSIELWRSSAFSSRTIPTIRLAISWPRRRWCGQNVRKKRKRCCSRASPRRGEPGTCTPSRRWKRCLENWDRQALHSRTKGSPPQRARRKASIRDLLRGLGGLGFPCPASLRHCSHRPLDQSGEQLIELHRHMHGPGDDDFPPPLQVSVKCGTRHPVWTDAAHGVRANLLEFL